MHDFLRRFRPYFREYRGRWAVAGGAGVIGAAAYGGVYLLIKPIMDGLFIGGDEGLQKIIPLAVVALFLVYGVGRYVQTYEINWIGEDIVRRLRDRLLGHVLTFDFAFFNAFRGGELIARVTNDIARIRQSVSKHLALVVRDCLVMVALLAVVVYTSPRLAFWGLVALPLAGWPISVLARRVKKFAHRSQEKDSDITSRLAEIFNNVEIIKAHHSEDFELERFKRDNLDYRRINMRGARAREMANPVMELLGAVGAALAIWVGGRLILSNELTPGEFAQFTGALFSLYSPFKRVSAVYSQFFEAVAASERIFEMLDRHPSIRTGDLKVVRPIRQVEYRDVVLSYGETPALRGVSLTVCRGEMLALVGDSGGGKSSLANLLPRLYDPDSGSVLIDGVDSRDLDLVSLRSSIGMVTQRVCVFNDTVAANVAYGLEVDRDAVEQALEKAGAWDFVVAMEGGIDAVLEEFGANLSGGQRQRLAIARAIYRKPDILILDEATSALDNRSEAAIQAALTDLAQNCITIVIAHRLSTVELADRVALLKNGVIVAEGALEELRSTSEEFRHLAAGVLPGESDPESA